MLDSLDHKTGSIAVVKTTEVGFGMDLYANQM